jgi:hypothetical protein
VTWAAINFRDIFLVALFPVRVVENSLRNKESEKNAGLVQ